MATTNSVAYVMYTSGSTGKPKGVMVEQHGIVSLAKGCRTGYKIGAGDVFLQLGNPAFDAATFEIWGALLNGGKLVMPTETTAKELTVENLGNVLQSHQVSHLWLTKSLFDMLYLEDPSVFRSLKYLLSGGEALTPSIIKGLVNRIDRPEHIVNGYGPTECTTFATTFDCDQPFVEKEGVPIGRSLSGRIVYILTPEKKLAAIGATGELFIGGHAVARGYLNLPDLTMERFISNPFGPGRLYKTGDLVRWNRDGQIQFIGRKDGQVKLRGFRIELDSISNTLCELSMVKQATVVEAKEGNTRFLAAYIVFEEDVDELEKNVDLVRQELAALVPEYMVPSCFIVVEELKLNHSGKLDRRALPKPVLAEHGPSRSNAVKAEPTNATETLLRRIWHEILRIDMESIGIHDNWFRIGGDSIMSIQLVHRLRQAGFTQCRAKDIFDAPTIARLAKRLDCELGTAMQTVAITNEQGVLDGEPFPLLPIQFWFFQQRLAMPDWFNQAFVLQLPESITLEQLSKMLTKVVAHHDALRLVFLRDEDGNYSMQKYAPPCDCIEIYEIDSLDDVKQLQQGFDIENGPLYRFAILPDNQLLAVFHHLVIDAVSWRILIDDLKTLHENGIACLEKQPKTASYRQWVQNVVENFGNASLVQEIEFWNGLASENATGLKIKEPTFATVSFSSELTKVLLNQCNQAYNTEINDLLLTALVVALANAFEKDDHLISLEGIGRLPELDEDVSRTVGWFTNIFPIRLTHDSTGDLGRTIIATKELLRQIPNKGIGFGALWQQGLVENPGAMISFNYLGQFGRAKEEMASGWTLTTDSKLTGPCVAPENVRALMFDINGGVDENSILTFGIHSYFLDLGALDAFAKTFESAMEAVIHHTKTRGHVVKTPSDFPSVARMLSMGQLESLNSRFSGIQHIFPATGLQQGFVYHVLAHPNDDAYRVQCLIDYPIHMDVSKYKSSWRRASIEYPALRLAFDWSGDQVLQIVQESPSIDEDATFRMINVEHIEDEEEQRNAILRLQDAERAKSFDLQSPGLVRFLIFKRRSKLFTVGITIHHAIVDGWSLGPLLSSVESFYLEEQPTIITEDVAFAAAQELMVTNTDRCVEFWENKKTEWGSPNDINFMLDKGAIDFSKTENMVVQAPGNEEVMIDAETLIKICRAHNVTVNAALQFAWHKVIQVYTGDDCTIVGTTVSGRDIPVAGIEQSVGLYINTLPLWFHWKDSDTIMQAIKTIHHRISELNDYSNVTLASLQGSGERLFHSLLVFESYPEVAESLGATKWGIVEKVDYPLAIQAVLVGTKLAIRLKYDETWLSGEHALEILGQLTRVLETVALTPAEVQSKVSLLTPDERHRIAVDWNQTFLDNPTNRTMHRAFHDQVLKTPQEVAIVYDDGENEMQKMTYSELNDRANLLALEIINRFQVGGSCSFIGLYFDRCCDMIASILAIQKAGAAYVPISPEYPLERVAFMVEDANPIAILTQSKYAATLADSILPASKLVVVDTVTLSDAVVANVDQGLPDDLAYAIYTSGSTGKPKGVLIPHRNGVHLAISQRQFMQLEEGRVKALAFANYVFDASISEIFVSLLAGDTLYIASEEQRKDHVKLAELIESNGIELATIPPSLLQIVDSKRLASLTRLILAGEAAPQQVVEDFTNQGCKVYNGFGPTEITVCSNMHLFKPGDLATVIGKPLNNVKLYVVNSNKTLVPIGAPGELLVGGDGVAQGYLNRPDLTDERFIANPFASGRAYCTGDIVRWMANGELQFLGRKDSQVKIRGYRVELDGIASLINQSVLVKQATVIDYRENGKTILVAFVVLAVKGENTLDVVRDELADMVPEYMVPSLFMTVEGALPLTPNGKIDRRALPKPCFGATSKASLQQNFVAPTTNTEKALCKIWAKILGEEESAIGIHSNWFHIGGDSITAMRLAGACQKEFDVQISVGAVLAQKTIANMAKAVDASSNLEKIVPLDNLHNLVLSYSQERLLFVDQLIAHNTAYHIPFLAEIETDFDIALIRQALLQTMDRHAILRTIYPGDDTTGKWIQEILPMEHVSQLFQVEVEKVSCLKEALIAELDIPFRLDCDLPMRVKVLLQEEDGKAFIFIVWHHIAFDGWSISIFLDEFIAHYNGETVAPLPIQYKDYAAWERNEHLCGERLAQYVAFWNNQLEAYENLGLPTDFPRPKETCYDGKDIHFALSMELSQKLRDIARRLETTLFTVMLSGFDILLSILAGQRDVVVGTPTANREQQETQSLIGFFVNSLALRAKINTEDFVDVFIRNVHETVLATQQHQALPFEKLVDSMNVERDTSRHPIFQVMFALQHFGSSTHLRAPFQRVQDVGHDVLSYSPAKFDLSLFVDDSQDEITASLNFATRLFKESTAKRMITQFIHVLEEMCVDGGARSIAEMDIVSPIEKTLMLETWNNTTEESYPVSSSLVDLMNQYSTSQHLAIQTRTSSMTYQALHEKADIIASFVQSKLGNVTTVAVYMERGIDFIVAVLGILKAGAAYVPMSYSQEKNCAFIVEDTGAPLLITDDVTKARDLVVAANVLVNTIPEILSSSSSLQSSSAAITSSASLAYMIYTSGSTGKPKGVMVEHGNVVNYAYALKDRVHGVANVDFSANHSFDLAVTTYLVPLLFGWTISVYEGDIMDVAAYQEHLETTGADFVKTTPRLAQVLLGPQCKVSSVKNLLVGGEKLTSEMLENISPLVENIYDEMGPTEITVAVTLAQVRPPTQRDTIGTPYNNYQVYVVDEHMKLVPLGAVGELLVGGYGVARGYLNRPELTSDKFIPNPFGKGRVYKTGDLVRWLDDGNMQYLGRTDNQCKIRGYRVEPEAISTILIEQFADIKDAVVIDCVSEDNNVKFLAAYVVFEDGINGDLESVKHRLSGLIPEYMVPASIQAVEKLFLTHNGKLDRRQLPKPITNQESGEEKTMPASDVEVLIASVWEKVLRVEDGNCIGIHDNWFRIGGDSILSIELVHHLRQNGFKQVRAKHIFDCPTVAQLSKFLEEEATGDKALEENEQGLLDNSEFPLLPIQQWFFNEPAFVNSRWFNQAFVMIIPSTTTCEEITSMMPTLVEQHDALRTVFPGNMKQRYKNQDRCFIHVHEIDVSQVSKEQLELTLSELQSDFDLENGPLYRVAHLTGCSDGKARIWFAFHHLVIDAVSWRILARDVKTILTEGKLAPKTASYRQWVRAVMKYAENHKNEVAFWRKQQSRAIRNHPYTDTCQQRRISVSENMTELLLTKANLGFGTEINDLLLSALSLAMTKTFGQKENAVTLEGIGRGQTAETNLDVSCTTGWFTTMYPVSLVTGGNDDVAETIILTKDNLRKVPNKGIGFGGLCNLGLLENNLLPEVNFNYLGQFDQNRRKEEDMEWSISTSDVLGRTVGKENVQKLLLNINGWVADGKLSFVVDSFLSSEKSELFAQAFQSGLEDVISTSVSVAASGPMKTPSDFMVPDFTLDQLRSIEQRFHETSNHIVAIYPASSLQQGFIYHAITNFMDDAYRTQVLLDYPLETFQVSHYMKAWELVSLKFPVLRASFDWGDQFVQVITENASICADNFVTLTLSKSDEDEELSEIQVNDRAMGFDFHVPGPIRFKIIYHHSQPLVTVMLSYHHIIMDGWSNAVLFETVHDFYEKLMNGMAVEMTVETAYLKAQEYYLDVRSESESFWKDKKEQEIGSSPTDITHMLSKPVDLSNPQLLIDSPATETIVMDLASIASACRENGVTVNSLVQFAWHKLLQVYSGTNDTTIVGTTLSGRDIPGIEGINASVGLYINTLPLWVQWNMDDTVLDVVKQIQKRIGDLNHYSSASLATIQTPGERLFHSLFIYENFPVNEDTEATLKSQVKLRQAIEKSDYPLCIVAYESGDRLGISLKYNQTWLEDGRARSLLVQLGQILEQVARNPVMKHSTLNLLSAEEKQVIVHDFNQTESSFDRQLFMHRLFEKQVELQGNDAVALVCGNESITYYELNGRANRLAREIHEMGYGKGIVALFLDRSIETVVAILAVLKAGCAFTPIEPTFPDDRVLFMLKDTNAKMVITQTHHWERLDSIAEETVYILLADTVGAPPSCQETQNLTDEEFPISCDDLAYVLYTSGTSGRGPKGAKVSHANLAYLMHCYEVKFPMRTEIQRNLWFASYVFDASIGELLPSLCFGHTTFIATESERHDIRLLGRLIQTNRIELVSLTPSVAQLLPDETIESVNYFIVAGEASSLDLLNALSRHGKRSVHNMYGPTEATDVATEHEFQHGDIATNIGKPLPNAKAYILSQDMQTPVPIGAPGELVIGGAGVSQGYLNRVELTEEKFIDNPFIRGEKVYRTGDIARFIPGTNGCIEYLGRSDFQVKIQGKRIELTEIVDALLSCDGIAQAAVIDAKTASGVTFLAAYIVITAGKKFMDMTDLKSLIGRKLPDYMVPTTYTILDEIPLTINRKLDRKALPQPVFEQQETFVRPRNELDATICGLFQQVLFGEEGSQLVGIHDLFSSLGGNSIAAIRVSQLAQKRHNLDVSAAHVLTKTPAEISDILSKFAKKQEEQQSSTLLVDLFPQVSDNNVVAEDEIFMVHPGSTGCECYLGLAFSLSEHLSSFGFDNYNIRYNDNQTESLQHIANIYVDQLLAKSKSRRPIHLLGWSLGGKIALEMASQLERRTDRLVYVYMLDTYWKPAEKELIDGLEGLNRSEAMINDMEISSALARSKVFLFKAYQQPPNSTFQSKHFHDATNGFQYTKNVPALEVIHLQEAHHHNILEKGSEIIIDTILSNL